MFDNSLPSYPIEYTTSVSPKTLTSILILFELKSSVSIYPVKNIPFVFSMQVKTPIGYSSKSSGYNSYVIVM